jgi:hypothetical protein
MERRITRAGRPHTTQGRGRLNAPPRRGQPGPPRPASAGPPAPAGTPRRSRTPRILFVVRYVVPALIVLSGIVALCFGTEDSFYGGVSLIGAGLAVALISWFYRVGVSGDADRTSEAEARRYFDRFGRWPD